MNIDIKEFLKNKKIEGVYYAEKPFVKKEEWQTKFTPEKHIVRTTCYHELIIEIDINKNILNEESKIKTEEIQLRNFDNLTAENFEVYLFSHKGKSPYLRLYGFEQLKGKNKKLAFKQFVEKYCEKLPEGFTYDESFTNENHFAPIEFQNHWRYNTPHQLLQFSPGVNKISFNIEEQETTQRKVEYIYWDILKMPEATEQQRVSCVMQIHNAHKQWSIDEVMSFITKHTSWKDFNPNTTRQKIEYVWPYTEKVLKEEKPEFGETQTELIDFSSYYYLFENTHKHLPCYDMVKTTLGFEGKEYYPLEKIICYKLESQRQPTITIGTGTGENHLSFGDNRIHLGLMAPQSGGKGIIKNILSLRKDDEDEYEQSVEISPSRTHMEQLIGKKVTETQKTNPDENGKSKSFKTEVDIIGYFGYKELIIDEAEKLLNEEGNEYSSAYEEIRKAEDIYGFNLVQKKQVDNKKKLEYFAPVRTTKLTHHCVLKPIFFDRGSYRRMFFLNYYLPEVDFDAPTKKYFAQGRINELKKYLNQKVNFTSTAITLNNTNEKDLVLIKEIIEWISAWNMFVLKHSNQTVRALGLKWFFTVDKLFWKDICVLSLAKQEEHLTLETIQEACLDTIHFLIKTFETYGNHSQISLSRDVWRTTDIKKARFLEWLWFNGATDETKSNIMIRDAWDKIKEIYGFSDTSSQSKAIIGELCNEDKLVKKKKGSHDSTIWLAFKPQIDGQINFNGSNWRDIKDVIESKCKKHE